MDQTPVAVALFSDGDNDDMRSSSQERLREAARALAANPRVAAVAIYGVSPENRRPIEECFAPLGDRLQLFAPEEIDAAPLLERLDAARAGRGAR
jgi:hypothetical protein